MHVWSKSPFWVGVEMLLSLVQHLFYSFTCPHVVPNLHNFLTSVEHKRLYLWAYIFIVSEQVSLFFDPFGLYSRSCHLTDLLSWSKICTLTKLMMIYYFSLGETPSLTPWPSVRSGFFHQCTAVWKTGQFFYYSSLPPLMTVTVQTVPPSADGLWHSICRVRSH